VFGQTQNNNIGITEGDVFVYKNSYFCESNDPKITQEFAVSNSTIESVKVEIGRILLNSTMDSVFTYYRMDGTQYNTTCVLEIPAEQLDEACLIRPGLNANDVVYAKNNSLNANDYTEYRINETITKTYSGIQRETNHFQFTLSDENADGKRVGQIDLYFDRETGIFVENRRWLQIFSSSDNSLKATILITSEITNSSKWLISESSVPDQSISPTPTSALSPTPSPAVREFPSTLTIGVLLSALLLGTIILQEKNVKQSRQRVR
jgi:hypothetical protein